VKTPKCLRTFEHNRCGPRDADGQITFNDFGAAPNNEKTSHNKLGAGAKGRERRKDGGWWGQVKVFLGKH